MLDFFTKLFTPVFITLGLVNPSPVIPDQALPIVQQEVVQEQVSEIEVGIEEEEKEETVPRKEIVPEIKNEPIVEQVVVTPEPAYVAPVIQKQNTEIATVSNPAEQIESLNQEEIEALISGLASTENNQNEQETGEAKCGIAEEEVFGLNGPTENLCINGTPTEITIYKSESYRWSCETEDDRDRCKAVREVDGVCGDVANTGAILKKGYDKDILCKEGLLDGMVQKSGEMVYFCNGTKQESTNSRCSVYIETDGECSDIKNGVISTLDQNSACKNGTISNLSTKRIETRNTKTSNARSYYQYFVNEYKYSCEGFNGGNASNCSIKTKELDNYICMGICA